jgi:3',5'-cyclic AMP phosphodiesterase CpdA
MPTLIQLSDLHFGPHHNSHLDEIVLRDIAALNPDAVIVSGDFTMRARHGEFEQARKFLAQIDKPWLAIPGNHDQPILPVADTIERFTHCFARYEKYIHPTVDSVLQTAGLCVIGLNDNRPILPGGFWSRAQHAWLIEQLARAPHESVKAIVTHHQLVWQGWRPAGFWRAERTLDFLARAGVELVLNGHTHVANAEQSTQGIVVARAGTATSGRLRHGNANAYNLISIDEKQIAVFVRAYDERADAFVSTRAFTFERKIRRGDPGWSPLRATT